MGRMWKWLGSTFALLLCVACVTSEPPVSPPSCTKQCGTACCGKEESCDEETNTCVACELKSCQALGKNCGKIPDGCAGILNCGTCSGGQLCGGGGAPNVCGTSTCEEPEE